MNSFKLYKNSKGEYGLHFTSDSHDWGDKYVDWDGINDAANYIPTFMRQWGRITVYGKEKYGTVRLEYFYPDLSLYRLCFPGHIMIPHPTFYWFDNKFIRPILQFFFWRIWQKYVQFIYKLAFKKAIKKWPHLEAEIMHEYDIYLDN